MSNIDDLIAKMCPDGVAHKTLKDVATVNTGTQLNRSTLAVTGLYPVMNGGINPSGYYNEFNTKANTTVISQGGASAGYVTWMNKKLWAGAHCFVVLHNENLVTGRFLYHFLKGSQQAIQNMKTGAGIPGLNRSKLVELTIPVPPLEIQKEIVAILDKFTELEVELEAELQARSKQFSHYLDEILQPDLDLPIITLSTVCDIGDGLHGTPIYDSSAEYFFINGNNLNNGKVTFSENTKKVNQKTFDKYRNNVEKEKTLFMSINGTIGSLALYTGELVVLGKSVAYFTVNEKEILVKYLYYILQSNASKVYFSNQLTGSTIKNLGLKSLRNMPLMLPPIARQKVIVDKLENLETMLFNEQIGIPAEIKARRQQYEYYRNKLLTFKELGVA
jgi:type I restriction enzyme S subunit